MILRLAALALVLGSALPAAAQESREIVGGLEFPTGIGVLDENRIVVNERPGRIRLIERGRLVEEPLATIPTTTQGETGLLDLAVPPDLATDAAVYVFATEADGASNTVWRVPLDRSAPTRVITGIPAAIYHNGGGVEFGPDGKLYVSNGEQHDSGRAQDAQAPGGKVYRYNADGSVPDDNPFAGSPTYALGLRNPFGLTIDPIDGEVWVTENGPSSFDEVNRVVAEGNYGWPEVSGPGCDDGCIDPVLAYESIIVPTGIAFADRNAPGSVRGDLFFASYGEAVIHRVELNEARDEATGDEITLRANEPIVGLEWSDRGLLYTTTTGLYLLPLASQGERKDRPSPEPDSEGRETPSESSSPSPAMETDATKPPWTIVVLAVLGASFFFLWSRLRHRSEEDARRDPTGL